ncbi:MAG TPA: adenylate kinase [Acidobacteriota bacterium]|nr:adenylate kinase [Acidobacteriota bacterium]
MINKRLAIIMLGPPGAGKGTQARIISEALHYPHVSTGDILRAALKEGTALGEKVKNYIESGALVPDELVDGIVAERIYREDCAVGFVLDGYPRTIPQALFLTSLFTEDGTKAIALGMEIPDKVLIERLSSRWTCPYCTKMFNANLEPGKHGGACDECNTELVQRKDDDPAVVAERLSVYRRSTRPLIRYYREQGLYYRVEGERPVKAIAETIIGIIKDRYDTRNTMENKLTDVPLQA